MIIVIALCYLMLWIYMCKQQHSTVVPCCSFHWSWKFWHGPLCSLQGFFSNGTLNSRCWRAYYFCQFWRTFLGFFLDIIWRVFFAKVRKVSKWDASGLVGVVGQEPWFFFSSSSFFPLFFSESINPNGQFRLLGRRIYALNLICTLYLYHALY